MHAVQVKLASEIVRHLEQNNCTFPVVVVTNGDDFCVSLKHYMIREMDAYEALYPCNLGTSSMDDELTSIAIVPKYEYISGVDWVCCKHKPSYLDDNSEIKIEVDGFSWFLLKTDFGRRSCKHLPIPPHAIRKRFLYREDLGVVYCLNYKAGCSYLARSIAGTDYKSVFHTSDSAMPVLPAIISRTSELFKFTVVRNPYSRIVSAYLDIIGGNVKEYVQRYAMFRRGLDLPKVGIIPFTTFIHRLEEKGFVWSLGAEHWLPQTTVIGYSTVRYNKLGKFEDMSAFTRTVIEPELRKRGDTREVIFPEVYIRKSGASNSYKAFYTDKIADMVYNLYEVDFELFKYDRSL